jgi:hypothetical protein
MPDNDNIWSFNHSLTTPHFSSYAPYYYGDETNSGLQHPLYGTLISPGSESGLRKIL